MSDLTVNIFRKRRGLVLRKQIDDLATHYGRDICILDVGGRAEYWDNVGLKHVAKVTLLNNDESEFLRSELGGVFEAAFGDARDLSTFADKAVDLVHSNSVIEHVGQWPDMCAMAREVRRVGRSGWVQTPAWEFPVEPHFRMPMLHWLGAPARRALLSFSPDYGSLSVREKRFHIDRINLLSSAEFRCLFPDCTIYVERLVLAKSYTARWFPEGMA